MPKHNLMRMLGVGLAVGLLAGGNSSVEAGVPATRRGRPAVAAPVVPRDEITRDLQVSEKMVELSMKREGAPEFDSDLARLSARERQFHEKLPPLASHPHLKGIVGSVSQKNYRPSRR